MSIHSSGFSLRQLLASLTMVEAFWKAVTCRLWAMCGVLQLVSEVLGLPVYRSFSLHLWQLLESFFFFFSLCQNALSKSVASAAFLQENKAICGLHSEWCQGCTQNYMNSVCRVKPAKGNIEQGHNWATVSEQGSAPGLSTGVRAPSISWHCSDGFSKAKLICIT